jgi:nucleotide-binding universal stress UspA family protein
MYHHILIGVDGGPGGRDAIALARRLADPSARLSLAHVYGREGISARVPAEENLVQRAEAMELLERERSESEIEAELESVAADSVGQGLRKLAASGRTDLIVVGSNRHGPPGRTLVADATRAALSASPYGVAIAPGGYRRGPREIGLVGIAYDLTEAADGVLCLAWEIACLHGAPLTALFAAPSPAEEEDGPLGQLEGHIADGELGRKVAAFSSDVDLLIVGSRADGALRRMIFGATADYLAEDAHCALLILPPPIIREEEFSVRRGRAGERG